MIVYQNEVMFLAYFHNERSNDYRELAAFQRSDLNEICACPFQGQFQLFTICLKLT